jgi:polyphosphate kinase
MNSLISIPCYTQNRELSWLRFNERVLMEAGDATVPLFERLKFISIFISNLDEFFMIRVGSLHYLSLVKEEAFDNKTGLTPKEQLDKVYEAVRPLCAKKDELYSVLQLQLGVSGVSELRVGELGKADHKYVKQLFEDEIAPILSPQIVDSHHPFPHLANKVLHIGALLKSKGKEVFGVIPVPLALPEIVFLPGADIRYIHTSEIILSQVENIFKSYSVIEKSLFSVTRNADIAFSDEAFEFDNDFRNQMKKLLHERKKLAAVRLELGGKISEEFQKYYCDKLNLSKSQIYLSKSPMNLSYIFSLEEKLSPQLKKKLTYEPFVPQYHTAAAAGESVMRQVARKDLMLSFPYESMEPFLQLLREAANDPAVISIKISIYRLANKAKLVEYLCAAAENGKEVTVLIELRARFDEQNNIDWSQRLEEAGCRIIYGFDAYKVHSKVCLITRKETFGVSYITQVGTGNYNEKTAALYADLSYITTDRAIGNDANEFFKNMAIGNLDGEYSQLLVGPNSMKKKLVELIDGEIEKGEAGSIFLKLNSVTDLDLMKKLQEASRAGVRVRMIVRGICCILPRLKGETENITITSIVGRFLEHSRVYIFGSGEEEVMYISSADFMTRNMERRIEVACPIHNLSAREKIRQMIEIQLQDNVKARLLQSDGTYCAVVNGRGPVNSQEIFMKNAKESARPAAEPSRPVLSRLMRLLGRKPETSVSQ